MKVKNIALLLTLLGAFSMTTGQAQLVTTYSGIKAGDLILGFDTASSGIGTARNLVVDLGSFANLGTLGSINLSSDLTTTYGASFATLGIQYGIFDIAGSGGATMVYATTPNAGGDVFPNQSSGALATPRANYNGVLGRDATTGFGYNMANSVNLTGKGTWLASGDINSWSSQSPSLAPFGAYGNTIETTIGNPLYLNSVSTTLSSVQVGTFSLSSAGILTYAATAVPEPSTYVLLGLGVLALSAVARRRQA
jgi:hypothetical protein